MTAALADYDQRIALAWAALQGARAAATRCPNKETLRLEDLCQHTLDDLLDGRPRRGKGMTA